MTRPHRSLLTLALALAGISCGDVSPTDPYTERAGSYVLRSINQQTLPAMISSGPDGTVTITSGSLSLKSDRTFTEIWTARIAPATGAPVNGALSEEGTYELNGDAITFHLPARPGRGALDVAGTFNADTLTYTVAGRTVVYLD